MQKKRLTNDWQPETSHWFITSSLLPQLREEEMPRRQSTENDGISHCKAVSPNPSTVFWRAVLDSENAFKFHFNAA